MPTVHGVAWKVVKDAEAAEDLAHTALAKMHEQKMVFPGMNNALYWLIRVVMNEARSFLRHRNAMSFVPLNDEASPLDASTEEKFFEHAEATKVKDALERLPWRHREILFLREYAGFQYQEIGEVLEMSESLVRVRVHRARAALLKLMGTERNTG
jgi:RNA polymerase sigma-70 factor (ECF subfamily)